MKLPPLVLGALLSACASRSASSPSTQALPAAPGDRDAAAPTPAPSDASTARTSCPEAPTPAPVSVTTTECPGGDILIAHRWHDAQSSDRCGPPAWVLHRAISQQRVAHYFPGAESAESEPQFRTLTDEEIADEHVTIPREPVWLFTANDAEPCQAVAGRAWIGITSAGGVRYPEIGVALHGCEMPREGDYVYAITSSSRPVACRYRAMTAARTPSSTPATPTPPTVRARITSRACAAPGCTFSWSLASLRVAEGVIDDVQGVYVFPRREVPECSYAHDWYHTVSWVPRPGAPWVRLVGAGPVTGVLYDGRGVRNVITDELGDVRVYATAVTDLGMLYPEHSFRWFIGNEEDAGSWTILPSCL